MGQVEAYDPGKRGAGDISFVAQYLDCLDGLGVMGGGATRCRRICRLAHHEGAYQKGRCAYLPLDEVNN